MTELGLILLINVAGLVFAAALVRGVAPPPAHSELARLMAAVGRASEAFLIGGLRQVGLGAAAVTVGLVVAHVLSHGGFDAAFWSTVALGAGALGAWVVAFVAVRLGVRASGAVSHALRRDAELAFGAALRAGAAAGLCAEALATLGAAGIFAVVFALRGGFSLASVEATVLGARATLVLPCFALGAVVATLVLQRTGDTLHAASDVASELGLARDAGLTSTDPRNPALIATLVGEQVGGIATRALDLYVISTLANAAMALLAAHAVTTAPGAALASVALPVVTRSFGVLASACGVMVVRAEERQPLTRSLWLGHGVAAVVATAGGAGASLWLIGEPAFLQLAACGALGLLAATSVGHLTRPALRRSASGVRSANEARRAGTATAFASSAGTGLTAAILAMLVLGAALSGSAELGRSTGLAHGAMLGLLTALGGALSCGPLLLGSQLVGALSTASRAMSAIASSDRVEPQRRAARLEEAGRVAQGVAQGYVLVLAVGSAVLAGAAVIQAAYGPGSSEAGIAWAEPGATWSAGLGLALVLAAAGGGLRAAVRVTLTVVTEIDRQLRAFPREQGVTQIPTEFTPSFRTAVDLALAAASRRALGPLVIALIAPVSLAAVLRAAARPGSLPVAAALGGFVIVAALAAFALGLALHATAAIAATSSRALRNGDGPMPGIDADALAHLLGRSAAPAAQIMALGLAISTLTIAPFLT